MRFWRELVLGCGLVGADIGDPLPCQPWCPHGDRYHCELEQTREHLSASLRSCVPNLTLLGYPSVEEPFGDVTTIPVSLTLAAKLSRTDIHLLRELQIGPRYGAPVEMMQLTHGIFDGSCISVIACETVREIGRLAGGARKSDDFAQMFWFAYCDQLLSNRTSAPLASRSVT